MGVIMPYRNSYDDEGTAQNAMKNIPTFLTIRQTAATGVLSEHHLRMMEKQGRLPGIRTGKTFRVNFEMLIAQLDRESMEQAKHHESAVNGVTEVD